MNRVLGLRAAALAVALAIAAPAAALAQSVDNSASYLPSGTFAPTQPGALIHHNNGAPCTIGWTGCPGLPVGPQQVTSTPTPFTVTTAGTFQLALAASASRKGCQIQNTSADTEYVFLGSGAATTGASLILNPFDIFNCAGGSNVVTDAIQITSATVNGATATVVAQ